MGADAHVTGGRAGHLYLGAGPHLGDQRAAGLGRDPGPERARRPGAARHYLGARRQLAERQRRAHRLRRPVRSQPGAAGVRQALHRRQPRRAGQPVRRRAPTRPASTPAHNDVLKLKGGVEATYLFLSWLGVSERFDHVRLHGGDSTQAYTSLASRLLFHTGWRSRGEIALQYTLLRLRQRRLRRQRVPGGARPERSTRTATSSR